MMKERQTGGKILKSAIAVLMAVAVAVLTLPGFKMDVRAVNAAPNYQVYVDSASMDDPTLVAHIVAVDTFQEVDPSTIITAGQSVYIQHFDEENYNARAIVADGLADVTPNHSYDVYTGGTLYTFTSNASFSISGKSVTFSAVSSGTSSAEEPAAPAAGTVKPDPAAMTRTIAEMQARFNAEQAALAQQREADRIYKAKLQQAQIDNRYFNNIAEANANGVKMVVRPNHSVLNSNIEGIYWANYSLGFAAIADNPSNLHIETWTVNRRNSPDAFKSINDANDTKLKGTLVGAIQVNIGEKTGEGTEVNYVSQDGKDVANVKFGVPDPNGKYAIVQVFPGGEVKFFENLTVDETDSTVSIKLPLGKAAYGIIRLPD